MHSIESVVAHSSFPFHLTGFHAVFIYRTKEINNNKNQHQSKQRAVRPLAISILLFLSLFRLCLLKLNFFFGSNTFFCVVRFSFVCLHLKRSSDFFFLLVFSYILFLHVTCMCKCMCNMCIMYVRALGVELHGYAYLF